MQYIYLPFIVIADISSYKSEGELLERIESIRASSLKSSEIQAIVDRQWFDAAEELVKKSHEEGVDISVPIRNGVSSIRSKLDNLVKLLDPEYVRPQIVNPAFQWAQSDTTIFILLKYSRRFNAPGAVEVENLNCTFTSTGMFFSAIGEHSSKRFEYQLNLDFFDIIDSESAKCTPGSVGKMTITIPKARISRWPRLLVTNAKIDNMHHWFDYGEKLESSLSGLPEITESGLTCHLREDHQYYCLTSESCKPSCSECKGKKHANDTTHQCDGPPAYGAKDIVFSDSNPAKGIVGGTMDISLKKDHHKTEIDYFNIYLVEQGANLTSSDEVWLKSNRVVENITKVEIPETPIDHVLDIVAVPTNTFGERRQLAVRLSLTDLFAPNACNSISDLAFFDTEGDKNAIKGVVTYTSPSNVDGATHVVFYWGKDEATKLASKAKSSIGESLIGTGKYNITSHTSIPAGATAILAFAKSPGGESDNPVGSVPLVDRYRPQSEPLGVQIVGEYAEITRASRETEDYEHVTAYDVRIIGEKSKEQDLDHLPMEAIGEFDPIPGVTKIPEKTKKVCAYLVNEMGRAKTGTCVETANREEL